MCCSNALILKVNQVLMGTKINKLALGVGLLAASSAATAAENQTFLLSGVMTLVYSTSVHTTTV